MESDYVPVAQTGQDATLYVPYVLVFDLLHGHLSTLCGNGLGVVTTVDRPECPLACLGYDVVVVVEWLLAWLQQVDIRQCQLSIRKHLLIPADVLTGEVGHVLLHQTSVFVYVPHLFYLYETLEDVHIQDEFDVVPLGVQLVELSQETE